MNTKKSRILWLVLLVLCLSAAITVAAFASDGTTTDEAVNNTSAATESTETESGIDVSTLGEPVKTWDISDTADDNVEANLYNDPNNAGYYILVISGTGNMKNWTANPQSSISPWITNYQTSLSRIVFLDNVTNIGKYAFYKCSGIKKIEIPDTIINIGYSAFGNCTSVKSAIIGDGVKNIDGSAFSGCSELSDITLGKAVEYIGSYVFSDCNLKTLHLPASLKSIEDYTFSGLTNLTEVYIDDINFWINHSWNRTWDYTYDHIFYNRDVYLNDQLLTEVIIPEGTTTVQRFAFYGCKSIKSVTLPTTLTEIGEGAFYKCDNIEYVYCNAINLSVKVDNYNGNTRAFYSSSATYVFGDKCTIIPNYFGGATKLNVLINSDNISTPQYCLVSSELHLVVSDNVTSLGYRFFGYEYFSEDMKSLVIGNNVTTIDDFAFYGAKGLETLYWNASNCEDLTSGHYSFGYIGHSSGGTKLVIGPNVRSIPANFCYTRYASNNRDNPKFNEIELRGPSILNSIGKDAFYYCSTITKVNVSTINDWLNINFYNLYANPLYYGDLYISNEILTELQIPENIEAIFPMAFYNCTSLESVILSSDIKSIGDAAFRSCINLKVLSTENATKCESIGASAFSGCTSLESIYIPSAVNSIEDSTFSNCKSLKSVYIPNAVISIGSYAFNSCTNLESIYIPSTVNSIKDYAFDNCTNLATVIINSSNIANSLIYNSSCGYLLNFAENVAIRVNTAVGSYVPKNFTHVTPVTYDGVEYNVYSKAEFGYNISSAYLQLTDDINVVYRTHIPEGYTDPYMEFVMNGVTYTVTDFTLDTEGRYCFGFMDIAPHKMSENISATVYANWNGMKVGVCKAEYSVKEYFEYILTAYADNADMVTMVSDLLIYGEKAQIFAGNSSDLVTDGLEDKLSGSEFTELDESANKLALNGEASENAKWASAALRLENEMAVKLGFVASDIEGLTVEVTINGRTTVYDVSELTLAENGRYYIFFRGIMAYEFDDEITAVFMQNGVQIGQTLTYSVNSYIYNSQSSDVEALADLVKSIYNYGASAKKYKGN